MKIKSLFLNEHEWVLCFKDAESSVVRSEVTALISISQIISDFLTSRLNMLPYLVRIGLPMKKVKQWSDQWLECSDPTHGKCRWYWHFSNRPSFATDGAEFPAIKIMGLMLYKEICWNDDDELEFISQSLTAWEYGNMMFVSELLLCQNFLVLVYFAARFGIEKINNMCNLVVERFSQLLVNRKLKEREYYFKC